MKSGDGTPIPGQRVDDIVTGDIISIDTTKQVDHVSVSERETRDINDDDDDKEEEEGGTGVRILFL